MKISLQPGRTRIHLALLAGGLCIVLEALAAGDGRLSAQPQSASPKHGSKIIFARDIAPIFEKSCNSCHGAEKPQAGLRLDSEAAALKGGESGKVIIPGDSEKSPLVKRLIGNGEEAR